MLNIPHVGRSVPTMLCISHNNKGYNKHEQAFITFSHSFIHSSIILSYTDRWSQFPQPKDRTDREGQLIISTDRQDCNVYYTSTDRNVIFTQNMSFIFNI